MIVVAGATGTTGGAVVAELLARGAPVRGLTRSEQRAQALRAAGAEAVVCDAADPASLARALRGVERLYVALPAGPDLPGLEENLFAVAEQSGAYAVVKLGVAGPPLLAGVHGESVAALQASSLRWTLLHATGFMQNHLRARDVLVSARGDARVAYVDARDVGAVAARALCEEGHEGSTYTLTGPQALTDAQVAAVLGAELRPVTDGEMAAHRRALGLPEWQVAALAELDAFYREGAASLPSPDVEAVLGRPPNALASLVAAG